MGENKELVMMRGNAAMAEAAYRGGADFYAGYPITPQSEILEHLSWRLPDAGRAFVQAENEMSAASILNGASMMGRRAITSSSGPGVTLKQEGFTYAAAFDLPIVYINVSRGGNGLATAGSRQTEYKREVNGGGNGDYRMIIYSPGFVQEAIDMVFNSFQVAEKHRVGVGILTESTLGHMIEVAEMPAAVKRTEEDFQPWRLRGLSKKARAASGLPPYRPADRIKKNLMKDGYDSVKQARTIEEEQQWESIQTEDAEYIILGFGVPGRVAIKAIEELRAEGQKAGLIRLKTLWPYPTKALEALNNKTVKGLIAMETNSTGQMVNDLIVHNVKTFGADYIPVYSYLHWKTLVPTVKQMKDNYMKIVNGEVKEVI